MPKILLSFLKVCCFHLFFSFFFFLFYFDRRKIMFFLYMQVDFASLRDTFHPHSPKQRMNKILKVILFATGLHNRYYFINFVLKKKSMN